MDSADGGAHARAFFDQLDALIEIVATEKDVIEESGHVMVIRIFGVRGRGNQRNCESAGCESEELSARNIYRHSSSPIRRAGWPARAKSLKCACRACLSNDARRAWQRRHARDATARTFFPDAPAKDAGAGALLPALLWPTPDRPPAKCLGGAARSIDRCRLSIYRCL